MRLERGGQTGHSGRHGIASASKRELFPPKSKGADEQGETTLDACIAEYLSPELLSDVTCEMCSLELTLAHYTSEVERLSTSAALAHLNGHSPRATSGSFSPLDGMPTENGSQHMTTSRKKRAREARRVQSALQDMLDSGTITHFGETNLRLPASPSDALNQPGPIPIKWQLAKTQSIRQAVVTRPPQTLRLHLIRSDYTPYGTAFKSTARIAFPLILDLTRFTARTVWEDASERTILGAMQHGVRTRVLYRLESVICHYGQTTSSGHYICVRRLPQHSGETWRPVGISKSCPDGCACEECAYHGQVREVEVPGRGWLRVSDDEVEEVGIEMLDQVRSQVFMLFYERVGEYEGDRVAVPFTPRSSAAVKEEPPDPM